MNTEIKTDLISVYKSSAPPFPAAVMASSYNTSLEKVIDKDICFKTIFCEIENERGEWWFSKEETEEIAEVVIDALAKNPQLVDKAQDFFELLANELMIILDKEKLELNLSEMDMIDVNLLFKQAISIYKDTTYWPEPANFAMEVIGHTLVWEKFWDFLKTNSPEISRSDAFEMFAILSNSTKASFVMEAELNLLKIALIKDPEEKERRIINFVGEFYWLEYDYYGPILDYQRAKDELKSFEILGEEEIIKRIQEKENFEKRSQEKLDEILNKIVLSVELSNIFEGMRKFAYFYGDLKKREISKANVGLGLILKEVSKRFNIDETDLHYATIEELEKIFTGNDVEKNLLKKRRQKGIFQVSGGKYQFCEALTHREKEKIGHGAMVKGMSACSGLYVGRARIINQVRDSGFNEGEVLVTKMTSVDFVPIMKKAGAIITDLGGITSHAAIVSRELNIPCVIGTKNATQIIKEGDLVQVNARHGIIKILDK